MIRQNIKIIYLLVITLFSVRCNNQPLVDNSEQKILNEIQQSHVESNIPNKSDFDNLLKRDLEKYFLETYGKVTIKWEYLREEATQSGVSYPKYYLWIKIYNNKKLINEGAVRIAAIEKKYFDITDYVCKEDIKNNKKDIFTIFPKPLCDKIIIKLK